MKVVINAHIANTASSLRTIKFVKPITAYAIRLVISAINSGFNRNELWVSLVLPDIKNSE